jgi:iron complex outermembrane recepter protein
MRVSLNCHDISIGKVIGVLPGGQALDKRYNLGGSNPTYSASGTYCALLIRDPTTGQLASILQETQNLGAIKTRGFDLQFDWRLGMGTLGLPQVSGGLLLNSVLTHAPIVDGVRGNTEPSTYDVLGRAFFISLRGKF